MKNLITKIIILLFVPVIGFTQQASVCSVIGDHVTCKAPSAGSLNFMIGNTKYLGINSSGYVLLPSVATALTAAGTDQDTALQLAKDRNVVTTTASGTGVILPVGVPGMKITVHNEGANTLNVYPETGGNIDGVGANTAVTIATTKERTFYCSALLTWYSILGA